MGMAGIFLSLVVWEWLDLLESGDVVMVGSS